MQISDSTTMPLTVKVVRAAAARVLKVQRERLDAKLTNTAIDINAFRAKENAGFFHKLFRREDIPMLDVPETVERWKTEGTNTDMHPAYWALGVRRQRWWKRLEQLVLLPKSDDDVIMQVSVDDLDLIEYNDWVHDLEHSAPTRQQ